MGWKSVKSDLNGKDVKISGRKITLGGVSAVWPLLSSYASGSGGVHWGGNSTGGHTSGGAGETCSHFAGTQKPKVGTNSLTTALD